MNIQLLFVLIAFSIALFLLGRKAYRIFAGKKDGDCDKCPGKS